MGLPTPTSRKMATTHAVLFTEQGDYDVALARCVEATGENPYCLSFSVTNETHADFGKLILPIETNRSDATDHLFPAEDLQAWNADWFPEAPPE